MKLPKSDEDIEQWAEEYPDVAKIVETIAIKKAKEQNAALEQRIKAIDDMHKLASDIRDRIKQIEKTDPAKAKILKQKLGY